MIAVSPRRRRKLTDPRARELTATQKMQLRDMLSLPAWKFLMTHWEADYQSLVKRLIDEDNIDEACRLQGELRRLERVMRTPEHYLENEE